jgi:hypothetical protein
VSVLKGRESRVGKTKKVTVLAKPSLISDGFSQTDTFPKVSVFKKTVTKLIFFIKKKIYINTPISQICKLPAMMYTSVLMYTTNMQAVYFTEKKCIFYRKKILQICKLPTMKEKEQEKKKKKKKMNTN